jgi:hypothetical protein
MPERQTPKTPRISADAKYLLAAGWVKSSEVSSGFCKRVFWRDPQTSREVEQKLALYIQERRAAVAAANSFPR